LEWKAPNGDDEELSKKNSIQLSAFAEVQQPLSNLIQAK